jgi:hypothetical protein
MRTRQVIGSGSGNTRQSKGGIERELRMVIRARGHILTERADVFLEYDEDVPRYGTNAARLA